MDLDARLAAAERRLAALEGNAATTPGGVTLAQRVAVLEEKALSAPAAAIDDIERRVTAIEEELDEASDEASDEAQEPETTQPAETPADAPPPSAPPPGATS